MSSSLSIFSPKSIKNDSATIDELEIILAKELLGSTELSSNENICIS